MPAPDFSAIAASINQRLAAIEAAQTTAAGTITGAKIAAFAALVAAVVSLFGAVVQRRNGFIQARATQQLKHAEFRQAWINALREEMAKFLSLTAQRSTEGSKEPEVIQSMAMILLRMNRKDRHYDALVDNIDRVFDATKAGTPYDSKTYGAAAGDFLLTCQKILKDEWETTRTGMLEEPPEWKTAEQLRSEKPVDDEARGKVPRSLELELSRKPDASALSLGLIC